MYACGLSYYAEIQGRHDPHGERKVDDNDDDQEEDAKVEQTLLPTVNPDRNVVVPRWILLLVDVPQLVLRPASHPRPPRCKLEGVPLASSYTW